MFRNIKLAIQLLLITFLAGIFLQASSRRKVEATMPHFGNNLVVLKIPNQELDTYLSPDGNSVFGYGFVFEERVDAGVEIVQSNQYFWNIGDFPNGNLLSFPEPVFTEEITTLDNYHLWRASFSFDSNYVASYLTDEVQIRSRDDLAIIETMTLPIFSRWGWSWAANNNSLGFIQQDEFMVWEFEENRLERHLLTNTFTSLRSIDNAWILTGTRDQIAFSVCSIDIEQCNDYEFIDNLGISTPSFDGQIILTPYNSDRDPLIAVWQRQQDGSYLYDEESLESVCVPVEFSSDNNYVFSYCGGSSWAVWNFDTVRREAETSHRPVFLSNPDFYVTFDQFEWTLYLYEFGNPEPVDILNLKELLETNNSLQNEEIILTWRDTTSVSSQGNWIMLDLVENTILVPLN